MIVRRVGLSLCRNKAAVPACRRQPSKINLLCVPQLLHVYYYRSLSKSRMAGRQADSSRPAVRPSAAMCDGGATRPSFRLVWPRLVPSKQGVGTDTRFLSPYPYSRLDARQPTSSPLTYSREAVLGEARPSSE